MKTESIKNYAALFLSWMLFKPEKDKQSPKIINGCSLKPKNIKIGNKVFVFHSYFFTAYDKGQIISKSLFGVFNLFQKTNENTLHTSKNEFIRSFSWKNLRLDNLLSKLTDL